MNYLKDFYNLNFENDNPMQRDGIKIYQLYMFRCFCFRGGFSESENIPSQPDPGNTGEGKTEIQKQTPAIGQGLFVNMKIIIYFFIPALFSIGCSSPHKEYDYNMENVDTDAIREKKQDSIADDTTRLIKDSIIQKADSIKVAKTVRI